MTPLERWGEEIPAREVVDPIVFNFRPNKFLTVDPEHRADWERFFHDNVGFAPRTATLGPAVPAVAKYPNGGISGSNGGWDD